MSSTRYAAVAGLTVIVLALGGCFDPQYPDPIRCAADGSCPSGRTCVDGWCGSGTTSDARPSATDARPSVADAAPIACERDNDCQTPPSPCHLLPGSCDLELGRCVFGTVDCTSFDDQCNQGVCNAATGECEARPSNEGQDCNGGTTCGAYGPCTAAETCNSNGTQSRECTSNTCQSGTCTPATYPESAACTRDTEDDDCQPDTVTGCGACGSFADICDEGGIQTCTCTDFKCRSDVCTPLPTSCQQSCDRDTDGVSCGTNTITDCTDCEYGSICAESAPDQTCTCNSPQCVSGSCTTVSQSCPQPCTRDTDGEQCACRSGCPAGEGSRISECRNQLCTATSLCDFCRIQ
jgi:hypothetical protein